MIANENIAEITGMQENFEHDIDDSTHQVLKFVYVATRTGKGDQRQIVVRKRGLSRVEGMNLVLETSCGQAHTIDEQPPCRRKCS